MDICESHPWEKSWERPAHLFVDASGSPAHLGAVLFCDHGVYWCHMAAPDNIVGRFRSRHDNQIMGLELLSIALGLGTFEWAIAGRKVVVHCDNTGAEVCDPHVHDGTCVRFCCVWFLPQVSIRKGSAKSFDHAQLVHAQWFHLTRMRAAIWVKRVGTHDNIADLPSRLVRCVPPFLFDNPWWCVRVATGLQTLAVHGSP